MCFTFNKAFAFPARFFTHLAHFDALCTLCRPIIAYILIIKMCRVGQVFDAQMRRNLHTSKRAWCSLICLCSCPMMAPYQTRAAGTANAESVSGSWWKISLWCGCQRFGDLSKSALFPYLPWNDRIYVYIRMCALCVCVSLCLCCVSNGFVCLPLKFFSEAKLQ